MLLCEIPTITLSIYLYQLTTFAIISRLLFAYQSIAIKDLATFAIQISHLIGS